MRTTGPFREAFSPLHNRNFSLYLGGQTISLVGTWMQLTAQSWVVWQLTHSTADLGIVAMLGSLPLLIFGIFGGVWADRLDRRKLLVVHAHQERKPASDNRLGDLVEGVRFIAAQPRVQDLLLVTSFLPFFVFSAAQLFPAIVTDRLHGGPEVLGAVMGASAAGALVSSLLILPFAQRVTRVGLMLATAVVWMGAWLAAIPFSDSTGVWVAGTFFAGLSSPVVMSTSGGLLQLLAPPDMRGRLMSAWLTFSFGIQPVGYLLVGYTGQLFGAPGAMLLNGSAMILGIAALLLLRPELRRWDLASQGAGRRATAVREDPAFSRRRAVGEDRA